MLTIEKVILESMGAITISEISHEEAYNAYKNTIRWLASRYAKSPVFQLKDYDYPNFAAFLCVDEEDLREYLLVDDVEPVGDSLHWLFHIFLKAFFAGQIINRLWQDAAKVDDASLRKDYEDLYLVSYWMSGMNADASGFVCLEKSELSWKYAIQDWNDYYPAKMIEHILAYQEDKPLSGCKANVPLLIKSVVYDMRTRINAIYAVNILLIMQKSPYYSSGMKTVARELYDYLIAALKNSRLIGMQINCNRPRVPVEDRGSMNDTTQLLLVYSYNNSDAYCLRLDLPHKGENYIHFNNRSPGGSKKEVESCVFFPEEYEKIIRQYKEEGRINNPEDYFIQYGQIYALKERENCVLDTEEQKAFFSKVEAGHRHVPFSNGSITENDVVNFTQAFANYFPALGRRPIDNTYDYATKCFHCDELMCQTLGRCISIPGPAWLHSGLPEKMARELLRKAGIYGIVNPEELDESFVSLEGVDLVIDETVKTLQPLFLIIE